MSTAVSHNIKYSPRLFYWINNILCNILFMTIYLSSLEMLVVFINKNRTAMAIFTYKPLPTILDVSRGTTMASKGMNSFTLT